jgi:hypothetical protein
MILLYPLHNGRLGLVFPLHQVRIFTNRGKHIEEDIVFSILAIIVTVIVKKCLGRGMIEVPIVIEEMLDERVLFGGKFINALAAFVVGAFNVFKDERQL